MADAEYLRLMMKNLEAQSICAWDQATYLHSAGGFIMSNAKKAAEILEVGVCGTQACLAGQTVINEGWKPRRDGAWIKPDGTYAFHGEAFQGAQEALDLTTKQAEMIFHYYTGSYVREETKYANSGPVTLSEFKEHITNVTGVTFED